jgi:hypothetical protein
MWNNQNRSRLNTKQSFHSLKKREEKMMYQSTVAAGRQALLDVRVALAQQVTARASCLTPAKAAHLIGSPR